MNMLGSSLGKGTCQTTKKLRSFRELEAPGTPEPPGISGLFSVDSVSPILKSIYPSPPDMTSIESGFSLPSMHFGVETGDFWGPEPETSPPELVKPPFPGTETKNFTASL